MKGSKYSRTAHVIRTCAKEGCTVGVEGNRKWCLDHAAEITRARENARMERRRQAKAAAEGAGAKQ